jgi:hypothetical protein
MRIRAETAPAATGSVSKPSPPVETSAHATSPALAVRDLRRLRRTRAFSDHTGGAAITRNGLCSGNVDGGNDHPRAMAFRSRLRRAGGLDGVDRKLHEQRL